MHHKFIGSFPKEEFYLYQVNENNELFERKKINSLSEGAAYINSSEGRYIISFTIKK